MPFRRSGSQDVLGCRGDAALVPRGPGYTLAGGGIGIVSTFVALLIVVLIPQAGLRIDGVLTWILAPVLVWLVTALATWLLPALFIKKKVQERRAA